MSSDFLDKSGTAFLKAAGVDINAMAIPPPPSITMEILKDIDNLILQKKSTKWRKTYYSKETKEQKSETQRQWYQKNREYVADRRKEYYKANRESIIAKNRTYYEKNKE
jgi:hypothetical protein